MRRRLTAWTLLLFSAVGISASAEVEESGSFQPDSLVYLKYVPEGFQIFNNCFDFYVTPGVLESWTEAEMHEFIDNFLDDDTLDGGDIFTQVWDYFNDGDLDSSQAGIAYKFGDSVLTRVRLDLYDPNDFNCDSISSSYCRGVGWGSTGWIEVANRRAYLMPDFEPDNPLLLGLLAHELQHSAGGMSDNSEEKWLRETYSELARYLTGNFKINRGVFDYNIPYDNGLTGACCREYTSKYWHWYLWASYLYEQFPGVTDSIQDDFMYQLIRSQENGKKLSGMHSLVKTFEKSQFHRFGLSGARLLKEVFNNWTIANYLDDTEYDQGQYGYKKIDIKDEIGLFRFNYGTPVPNSGITPSEVRVDTSFLSREKLFRGTQGNDSLVVEVYAADYIRLMADSTIRNRTGLDLRLWISWLFDERMNANIGLQVNCLLFAGDKRLLKIEKLQANQTQAEIIIPGFGAEVAEAVVILNAVENVVPTLDYYYYRQPYEYSIRLGSPAIQPKVFELAQNYPNPFNSRTVIKINLAQEAEVKLEIFNLLGRRVKTLLHQKLTAGSYNLIWDGSDNNDEELASGPYFYRLDLGGLFQSKKMLLIK